MRCVPRVTVRLAAMGFVAVVFAAACTTQEASAPAGPLVRDLSSPPAVQDGYLVVCKSTPAGTSGTFEIDVSLTNPDGSSAGSAGVITNSGQCKTVESQGTSLTASWTAAASENLQGVSGWSLSSVTVMTNAGTVHDSGAGAAQTSSAAPTSPATCLVSATAGCVLIFNNVPTTPPPPTACVIPPSGTAIGGSPVSWNGFNAPTGSVVWINAHLDAKNVPTNTITTVNFTGVTLVVNTTTYALPNGQVVFNPAVSTPTTVVNADGSWTTTVNPSFNNDIFFDGGAIPVDANMENGGHGNTGSTLSFSTNSSDTNLSFQWQWSAAVYTSWPGNAAANIEPVHGQLQAGAPQNTAVEADLIQGPRGGGGSNFTGSWSGTGQGTCPQ